MYSGSSSSMQMALYTALWQFLAASITSPLCQVACIAVISPDVEPFTSIYVANVPYTFFISAILSAMNISGSCMSSRSLASVKSCAYTPFQKFSRDFEMLSTFWTASIGCLLCPGMCHGYVPFSIYFSSASFIYSFTSFLRNIDSV